MNIQGIHSNLIPMAATSSNSTNSTSSSGSGSSNSGAVSSNSQVSESAFLQLIATELQSQDPTNPLDPSQFLGQLVQFNTLDQVTGIYNILSQGAAASGSGSSTGSSTSSQPTSPSTSPATQGL